MDHHEHKQIIENCLQLLDAYKKGLLGQCTMPEDTNPGFKKNEKEPRLSYFTLPMSLNYQRDSYKLWESALKTYQDNASRDVFSVNDVSKMTDSKLRKKLQKYKVALQPNKHINTWSRISETISDNWGSISNLIEYADSDYLKLKQIVQHEFKKGFPYLSGPKIFNYWSFIITTHGGVKLKNRDYIDIAPDTHVVKCSVQLNVISEKEAKKLSRDLISERWRMILKNSDIDPIDMHSPLWFWSRNGFTYKLK